MEYLLSIIIDDHPFFLVVVVLYVGIILVANVSAAMEKRGRRVPMVYNRVAIGLVVFCVSVDVLFPSREAVAKAIIMMAQ